MSGIRFEVSAEVSSVEYMPNPTCAECGHGSVRHVDGHCKDPECGCEAFDPEEETE